MDITYIHSIETIWDNIPITKYSGETRWEYNEFNPSMNNFLYEASKSREEDSNKFESLKLVLLKYVYIIFVVITLLTTSCENNPIDKQEKKKQDFITLLGNFQDNRKVKIKEISIQEFEEFTRKLIQYELLGETIQAYVLIPKNSKGKVPGILAIHQDGEHRPYEFGKGEPAGIHGDSSLFYGLELCKKGYVVICPDRFGFESRMLQKSKNWNDFASFPVSLEYNQQRIYLTEDLYIGARSSQLITEGKTMIGMTIIELKYAIDILCSIKEVDKERIGVIGHSAGGFLAGLLMYVDDRIKVGCSSCGSFLLSDIYNESYLRPMNGFCGLLTIPGIKQWGDFDDVIEGIYPRSFIELSADIDRSTVFEKAIKKQIFIGNEIVIKQKYLNLGQHSFTDEMKNEAYSWFERHFK